MMAGRAAGATSLIVAILVTGSSAEASDRLIEAAKNGNRTLVQSLLSGNHDANVADADGMTALHFAVRADDLELTRALLRAGARVTTENRYGVAPLSVAAINGNPDVIETLLRAGADPNTSTPDGETALMTASRTGSVRAVQVLLDHGADPAARERWNGEDALMWAAAENHGAVVRLLSERGADLNARSAVLEYPDVKIDIALVWRVELPRGGLTPLMFAARQGALESARILADMGADLDVTDPDGTTALVTAVINAHYDVAALLIDQGADPNIPDAAGMAPLYAAVDMHLKEPMFNRPLPKPSGALDALDLINLLLGRGADPNARLRTPLLARQHDAGDPSLGDGATPLMRAARASDVTLMRLLIGRGADPLLRLKNGTTIAMIAAARSAPNAGSERETIEALEICLSRGVDINAASENGATALHVAVGKSDAIVRFLAERGASLDATDEAGRTPLDVALGVPGKGRDGRPGQPGPIYESAVALLRTLMGNEPATQR
jgi:uncharacterized protein